MSDKNKLKEIIEKAKNPSGLGYFLNTSDLTFLMEKVYELMPDEDEKEEDFYTITISNLNNEDRNEIKDFLDRRNYIYENKIYMRLGFSTTFYEIKIKGLNEISYDHIASFLRKNGFEFSQEIEE